MGHIRLGRLPRTIRWLGVIDSLASPNATTAELADRTLSAASVLLGAAAREPGCYRPLGVLSRLVLAAHSSDSFARELDALGVERDIRGDGLRLISALGGAPLEPKATEARTALSEIADRAYREVLLTHVRERATGLWDVAFDDVRIALRDYSTERGYRELARVWFGKFVGHSLQYFVDRELSNFVGVGAAQTSAGAVEVERQLLAYAFERTRILADYAPAWLSKTTWVEGTLSDAAVRRFFAYSIKKILSDVQLERSKGVDA